MGEDSEIVEKFLEENKMHKIHMNFSLDVFDLNTILQVLNGGAKFTFVVLWCVVILVVGTTFAVYGVGTVQTFPFGAPCEIGGGR